MKVNVDMITRQAEMQELTIGIAEGDAAGFDEDEAGLL